MKKKKHLLFLWIALVLFIINIISTMAYMQIDYYQTQADFVSDPQMAKELTNFSVFVAIVFIFPIFAVELSCIRSVYKFLKYNPCGVIKICYLLSAILSFFSFTFCGLIFLNIVGFKTGLRESVLLWIEWPVLIVSFILGSIPIKHNDRCTTDKNIEN